VKERKYKVPELKKINGAKPVIPERKPEKAKKHIRRSGKRRRKRRASQ
jgi:hypothetical protein